jgi:hypothetical protein
VTLLTLPLHRSGASVYGAAVDFAVTAAAPSLVELLLSPMHQAAARELTFNVTALPSTRAVGRATISVGLAGLAPASMLVQGALEWCLCDARADRGATDVDECALGTDNCHANATCSNLVGVYRFQCVCDAGWEGNGTVCERESQRCHHQRTLPLALTVPLARSLAVLVSSAIGPCTFGPCWPGDAFRPPANCTNTNRGRPFSAEDYVCAPCPATMVGNAVGFFGCKSERCRAQSPSVSAATHSCAADRPSQPAAPVAVAMTPTSLTLSWPRPSDNRAVITGYALLLAMDGGMVYRAAHPNVTEAPNGSATVQRAFHDLTPLGRYWATVQVCAHRSRH